MDRYLFRGKRVENGEWVKGAYASNGGVPRIIYSDYEGFHCEDIVTPRTVGQCTGLKDGNGKLIFEGDIVQCLMLGLRYEYKSAYENGAVKFNDGCFDVDFKGCRDYLKCFVANNALKVIGNIHDNPELLEVDE